MSENTAARARPVLVVEDDPALGRVIELVLQAAGYLVVPARVGRDALDKIALGLALTGTGHRWPSGMGYKRKQLTH